MAITINDLKLIESENMTNASNGGGSITSNVIIDGASNNIFDDISLEDRAIGKVNERKVFLAVQTLTNDRLFSAFSYVSKLPLDEKINVNLFKSQAWFDERSNRIVKQKTSRLKTIIPESSITSAYSTNNSALIHANTKNLKPLYDQRYNIGSDANKSFNCFLYGQSTAGDSFLTVFGFDGCKILESEVNKSAFSYGVVNLKNIFKGNSFLIKDLLHEELIEVTDVNALIYQDIDRASSDPYILEGETTTTISNTLYAAPLKKYVFFLTLKDPLAHTYSGSNINSAATWLSSETKLLTLDTLPVTTTTPSYVAYTDTTEDKFYTAKKLTTNASLGATTLTISSNENKVIPLIEGIILGSEALGIDESTFSVDGIYEAFSPGDVVIILSDKTQTGTYTNSSVVSFPEINLSKITVRDNVGNFVDQNRYIFDLADGWLAFVNVSGLSQPLTITHRVGEFGLVASVSGNTLTLSQPLSRAYSSAETIVSNCLSHGSIYAAATRPFDQQTWTNVWQDTLIGSSVSAHYNFSAYPIIVNNLNAIEERWAIIFTTSTSFNVIGEHLGMIVSNASTSVDLKPNNPFTNQPYFEMKAAGFGGGWAAGNVIRFNTYAAAAPFWVLQSISQGAATDPDFNFEIEVRASVDALPAA